MKKYKIAVDWEMYGEIEIEADSLEEAIQIAIEDNPSIPLPEGEYIDGSWKVNEKMSRYLNGETEND